MFINLRLPFGLIIQIYKINLKSERKRLTLPEVQHQLDLQEKKQVPPANQTPT